MNGKLKRGKLTLYNTDVLKTPYGNTFVMPKEVGKITQERVFMMKKPKNSEGLAGSAKEAYASIDELDDKAYYIAYGSLDELTGYADFYNWAKGQRNGFKPVVCSLYIG